MRPRFTLASRILLLALGNLILIVLALLIFVRAGLPQGFGDYLMMAGRDRARLIAQQLSVELTELDESRWSGVLEQYSAANHVSLMIYNNHGVRVAGPALNPPPEVKVRLQPKSRSATGSFAAATWLPPFIVIAERPMPYWLGVWVPIAQENVTRETPSRWELVVASPTLLTNSFFFPLLPLLEIAGIALAITVLFWLPMIVALTRSLTQMMSATARIAEGQFDVQVQASRHDELGSLGASINRMAQRLDSFTRGRNRFLGDVAHELRSPLGRIQAALGILENGQPFAGACDASHATLADLREEVEMMSGLTEELLTFARSRLVPDALELVPVNLAAVVSRVIKAEKQSGTTIRAEISPSFYVKAEPEYLFRSIANTIRNAVRYAGLNGEIVVSAEARGEFIAVSVADSGPGIPEESLERIFTPFYRPDPSRDRRSGGTGLGLSIVRGCIEACQGSVTCRNRTPTGLEVTMTLNALSPAGL